MTIDLKQFLPHVEHCDLSEEQKLALLEDLWSIMSSFADEAWGLCPVQNYANDNEAFSRTKHLNLLEYFNADNVSEPEAGESSEAKDSPR